MGNTHRLPATGALILCLIGAQWSGTLCASELESSSKDGPPTAAAVETGSDATVADGAAGAMLSSFVRPSSAEPDHLMLNHVAFASDGSVAGGLRVWHGAPAFRLVESASFADAGQFRGRRSRGRNAGAATVIALGAVASITGAAVLVYANRPECATNRLASGCGYGTKVVGGAVLTGGIVGIVAGALAWR
jgi:hypothetical protein